MSLACDASATPTTNTALRFGDYWKLGLPLLLLFGAVATFLVPAIWRYRSG